MCLKQVEQEMQIIRHKPLNKAGGTPYLHHGLMAIISGFIFLSAASETLGRNVYVADVSKGRDQGFVFF